jgi:hypothetical protein
MRIEKLGTRKEKKARRGASLPVASFLFSLFFFLSGAPAAATTVTGAVNLPDRTPVNGTLEFTLSQRATTTAPPAVYVPETTTCAITDGQIAAACTVQANDTLDPAGTFYRVRILDANNRALGPTVNYTISGTTVDLGSLPVTATDTLVPPDGSVTGNLNVTGDLTVGGSADFGADPQEFDHLRLRGLTADPATVTDGSLWNRSDLERVRFQARGLQLFDGANFIDITASTNSIDIGGNLKVGGGTDLGGFADLKCSSEPAPPSGSTTRLYCLSTDAQYFFKDASGVPFGPLASINRNNTWAAGQNFKVANQVRFADQFPGADAGAKIDAARADLSAAGGAIDARGLEGAQSISSDILGAIPNTQNVSLHLGDSTYSVTSPQAIASPLYLLGNGRSTVFDLAGGNNFTGFTVNNNTNNTYPRRFQDFTVTNTGLNTGVTFFKLNPSIFGFWDGVQILGNDDPADSSTGFAIGDAAAGISTLWNTFSRLHIGTVEDCLNLTGNPGIAEANDNRFFAVTCVKPGRYGAVFENADTNNIFAFYVEQFASYDAVNDRAMLFKNGASGNAIIGGGTVPFSRTFNRVAVEFQPGATGNMILGGGWRNYIDADGSNSFWTSNIGLNLDTSGADNSSRSRWAPAAEFSNHVDSPQGFTGADYLASAAGGVGRYQNLLLRSEEFNNAAWSKTANVNVTPDAQVAPDGSTTADELVATGSSTVSQIIPVAAAGKTLTFSVWLWTTTGIENAAIGLSDQGTESKLCHARADTRRRRFVCSLSFSGAATGNAVANIKVDVIDGTGTVAAWGAQLRDTTAFGTLPAATGYYHAPGVYVPTTTATVSAGSGFAVNRGIFADSRGFKHARVATGSVAAGDSAAVTVTWTTPFVDTNYTIVGCEVEDATAATLALRKHHIESRTASAATVRIVNDDGASAHSGTLHCTAVHD